jgi:hypothetical protein
MDENEASYGAINPLLLAEQSGAPAAGENQS